MTAIAVPTNPLPIITPPSYRLPNEDTIRLIQAQAKELIHSDKKYSVTFSPMLAPAGKNFLFTLHPHYWKVGPGHWGESEPLPCLAVLIYQNGETGNGTLVRPNESPLPGGQLTLSLDASIPQGQQELEAFSMAIRILALTVQHIPELAVAAQQKTEELLQAFFVDPETR